MKKYKYTGKTKNGLHQIIALRSFGSINKGTIGGYVRSHKNLSHEGDAWVSGDARVYGDARVFGGKWSTSPLQIQGSKAYINICNESTLKIGCYEKTIPGWMKEYKDVGKKEGYTEAEIAEYGLYIKLAQDLLKITGPEG